MTNTHEQAWKQYCETEIARVSPILHELGYELESEQPHIQGERYLMQAVTTKSGRKLILLGRNRTSGQRVVIKVTREADGIRELTHEQTCRAVLQKIGFAYQSFLSPETLVFTKRGPYLFLIQAFIEQERPFLARPLKEQFFLALKSFKAQESAHATTYAHTKLVTRTFGSMDARGYLDTFAEFRRCVPAHDALLTHAEAFLHTHKDTIEQYSGFLTHTDFVPHNFRIAGDAIYLLDHSALRFGNKYEGWARFLNFMTLYNRPLEQALVEYVRLNRTLEESRSLQLMRIYRLGEIMCYYTRTLEKSEGNLFTLNSARIQFWSSVLEAALNDVPVADSVVSEYVRLRDSLRSSDESRRQKDLH